MAITPTIVVFDLDLKDVSTDAAALTTWKGTLTIAHIYGWSIAPISSTRFRYTLVYD